MVNEEAILTKAIITGLDLGEYNVDDSMSELTELCIAGEMEVVAQVVQKKDRPDKKTYLGIGKLEEIKGMIEHYGIEVCVIDDEITGSQIKNLEDVLEIEVIDRTMLILEIFDKRATTSEGKLQTELALLKYRLPRLTGLGTSMSRQGGGGAGGGGARRGGGESKLEYDRRHIKTRIDYIKQKLLEVEKRRTLINEGRKKNEVPIVALTGYTNVGKSSILNALTNSEVLEKDMLFATLDPTARGLTLPSGQKIIMVDTVGFVSRLPHKLVEAFKSTLEQVKYADVVINVCDVSNEDRDLQLETTKNVLGEMDCNEYIIVYNKCDNDYEPVFGTDIILTSTKDGYGLDKLVNVIDQKLSDRMVSIDVLIPYANSNLESIIRENGKILSQEYAETGIKITGFIDKKKHYMFEIYAQN